MSDGPVETTRVALGPGVSRDDVDSLLLARGLRLVNVVPASATHPRQVIYTTPGNATAVYLIDDERAGARYLLLTGADAARIAGAARGALDAPGEGDAAPPPSTGPG